MILLFSILNVKEYIRMLEILLKNWMGRNANTSAPPATLALLGIPVAVYIALSYCIIGYFICYLL